jgi:LmbE family N-acetylglucosaminyl deacetylase
MRFPFLAALSILCAAPSAAPAEAPHTLLAVFAHPDDETLVAPLLAAYARRGVRVHLAIVTDGEKGTQVHAGIPAGPELAKVRAEEARCSARALGIEPPMLLGFKDGELGKQGRPPWAPLAEVQTEIAKVLQRVRPDAVITFGPEGAYGHPDHRLVGAVVTQLVQASADGAPARLFYPGFPKDRLSVVAHRSPFPDRARAVRHEGPRRQPGRARMPQEPVQTRGAGRPPAVHGPGPRRPRRSASMVRRAASGRCVRGRDPLIGVRALGGLFVSSWIGLLA